MAEKNIVRFSLRLNLTNQQHAQIYKVLSSLDKDVHKSGNQFILNAVDFYIHSFENDAIMDKLCQNKNSGYVTADDLADIRRELEGSMKDELIRLLGSVIMGGLTARGHGSTVEALQRDETEENNTIAAEAANLWG